MCFLLPVGVLIPSCYFVLNAYKLDGAAKCSAYPQLTYVSFFVRWNAASNKGCDGMVRMVKRTIFVHAFDFHFIEVMSDPIKTNCFLFFIRMVIYLVVEMKVAQRYVWLSPSTVHVLRKFGTVLHPLRHLELSEMDNPCKLDTLCRAKQLSVHFTCPLDRFFQCSGLSTRKITHPEKKTKNFTKQDRIIIIIIINFQYVLVFICLLPSKTNWQSKCSD